VILYPNLGYMVITCAMLALGLAGIHAAIRPIPAERALAQLPMVAFIYGVSMLTLQPLLNLLPFRFEAIAEQPVRQAVYFALMYLVVGVPFFIAGRIFTVIFSHNAARIGRLYGADLAGAAIGCLVVIPLLRPLGPGGIILVAAASAWVAGALLEPEPRRRGPMLIAAVGLVLVTVSLPGYIEFDEHKYGRGLGQARREGNSEFVAWDPISKIEVITWGGAKNVMYDGGTQSSFLYPFDGDYTGLRERMDGAVRANREDRIQRHFWYRGVFISHYLKRDSGFRALILGSAAGQEVKAALTFGAAAVEAVELVPTVVEFGLDRYAEFNGGIFLDPRVRVTATEGRAYLRASGGGFDIIQMHSNHSSSSIAGGVGALDPTYLMTVDAFREYFEGLTADGILHINHHIYPRMVTTAARAWAELGREDFQRHVVVVHRPDIADTLPTVLIKMSPWTQEELREIRYFFSLQERHAGESEFAIAEDPLSPRDSFLSPEFYSGTVSDELRTAVPYRVIAATDDRPYFKFVRQGWGAVDEDPDRYVDLAIAGLLNEPVEAGPGVPMDVLHLVVVGLLSIGAAVLFVGVPLMASDVGRSTWPGKMNAVAYFSCLGLAFIIIELVLIQKLMRFIGFPLHTYSTVIFSVLLGAGLGSALSGRLGIRPGRRMWVPFAGIAVVGVIFLLSHSMVFSALLHLPVTARICASALLILPLAFLMGMPFPLGILAIERHGPGAVAWGWAMNGVFTVIGGLLSVILSLWIGFAATELIAILIYLVAGAVLYDLHRRQEASTKESGA
jgi:spermidine synthase